MMRACLIVFLQLNASFVLALAEEKPSLQTKVSEPVGVADFFQVALGLLVIVAVIFVIAWVVKRAGFVNVRSNAVMQVLASMSLSQRERVILIQVGEQQLLLGVAPGRITTLCELKENINVQTPVPAAGYSFSDKLNEVLRGRQR